MSVGCVLGRLYTRETRRFCQPGKQAVSVGGSVYAAAQMLRDRRRRKPLLILDTEERETILAEALRKNDVAWSVFVLPSFAVTTEWAITAGQLYRAEGCDCILALGGSAAMDAAKAAAACAAAPGLFRSGKARLRLRAPAVPMIFAIPVTADSTFSAGETVVYDGDGCPRTVKGKKLVPSMVLLDPALLADASREDLADAGFEGLCMAVEAYLTPGKGNAAALVMAERAVKGYIENLEPCWNDGGTQNQRSGLMEASRLAGLAYFALGYGHARSICKGLCRSGVAPGAAYGVVLPGVLEKYGNPVTDKLSRLASVSGILTEGSRQERAAALIRYIRDMAFRLGIPDELPPIPAAEPDRIAFEAAADVYSLPPVDWTEEKCRILLEKLLCFPKTEN